MGRTLFVFRHLCALTAVALLASCFGRAQDTQTASLPMPQTVEDVLHRMSDQADVIFLGEVAAIRPHDDGGLASGFIEIDFRVDRAIRGISGGTYTLREWEGLWSGNAVRYRTGERLLMLLHAPAASGLSSPVGGMDGAIPISGGGAAPVLANTATPASTTIVDLRWLGTRLPQSVSFKINPILPPTPLTVSQQMTTRSVAAPITSEDDASSRASVPAQQASVDTVVKLLASWKKAADDVR